jgi:hypothetical protein
MNNDCNKSYCAASQLNRHLFFIRFRSRHLWNCKANLLNMKNLRHIISITIATNLDSSKTYYESSRKMECFNVLGILDSPDKYFELLRNGWINFLQTSFEHLISFLPIMTSDVESFFKPYSDHLIK